MNTIQILKSEILYVSYNMDSKTPFEKSILIFCKDSTNTILNLNYYTLDMFNKWCESAKIQLEDKTNNFLIIDYKI